MNKVILVRPGTTDYDEQHRITGTLQIPLNVKGQSEIAEVARALKGEPVDVIYASDDAAAKQSAESVGEALDVPVKVLDELHNLDFGLWQGLPVEEIRRKHPRLYKQWNEHPETVCPPAGETIENLVGRVHKAMKRVVRKCQRCTVVVVAPEPLLQVIRSELTHETLGHLPLQRNGAPQWETIEPTPGV